MYELFVMALKEYWNEQGDTQEEVNKSVEDLQNVLSEHYKTDVHWSEPEPDPAKADDEISVCAFTDAQFVSLQAVAAALELDGNLEDLDLDPENPWDSDIFERLEDHLNGEDDDAENDIKLYPQVLNMGQSAECFIVPSELPFVAQISTDDECDCDHDEDDECECCCDDESCIEIASLPALRRELDELGKVLDVDPKRSIDEIDEVTFDDEDVYREAKLAWYLLNARVNEAIEAGLPLILHFNDEEGEDYEDEDEDED